MHGGRHATHRPTVNVKLISSASESHSREYSPHTRESSCDVSCDRNRSKMGKGRDGACDGQTCGGVTKKRPKPNAKEVRSVSLSTAERWRGLRLAHGGGAGGGYSSRVVCIARFKDVNM